MFWKSINRTSVNSIEFNRAVFTRPFNLMDEVFNKKEVIWINKKHWHILCLPISIE